MVATPLVSTAEIDGLTYSSPAHNVRLALPRDWRVSDQPSYPGVLLRMFRTSPPASITIAVDPTADLLAAVPPECDDPEPESAPAASAPARVSCLQATRLAAYGATIKRGGEGARPWFDAQVTSRSLRLGVTVEGPWTFTVVLSAQTDGHRGQYGKAFERTLRGLRPLDAADDAPTSAPAPAPPAPATAPAPPRT